MFDPDDPPQTVSEMLALLARIRLETDQSLVVAARELNRTAASVASSVIETAELTEIRCDPEDRPGAELAKRQLIDAMRVHLRFVRSRFAE